MTFPPKGKPWSQFPMDFNVGDQAKQCLDYILTQINQLVAQGQPPSQTGLTSLVTNTIDPTGNQIISKGSVMPSVTTKMSAVPNSGAGGAGNASITIYWDGQNSSQVFQLLRGDGTSYGPNPTGSPLVVSGLNPSTTYFFYPYFDELVSLGIPIHFASIPNVSVGNPAIAFPAQSLAAAQQQILNTRVPLAILFATTGVPTPATGAGTTTSGGNGGAGSGGNGGHYFQ